MNRIPLFKVRMAPEAKSLVAKTLESGYVGEGPRVKEFEKNLQEILGLPRRPVAVSSGTAALDLAYELCGFDSPLDQVAVSPMTCFATVAPLLHRRVEICWLDVDPETGCAVAPGGLKWEVRGVVTVDWAGRPAPIPATRWKIQDAAHALGGAVYGDYVCYSFQAIKHLTTGDGGALLCPEPEEGRARRLRWFGLDRDKGESFRCAQDIEEPGFKYHMNDVAASIGLASLPGLPECLSRHRGNARRLYDGLTRKGVMIPPFDERSSYWIFTILCESRDRRDSLEAHLKHVGIDCGRVHRPCDEHPCVAAFKRELPGVREFDARHLELPCGWWLDEHDTDRILKEVERWSVA